MRRAQDAVILKVDGREIRVSTHSRDPRSGEYIRTDYVMWSGSDRLGVVFRLDRGEPPDTCACHQDRVWYTRTNEDKVIGPFPKMLGAVSELVKDVEHRVAA